MSKVKSNAVAMAFDLSRATARDIAPLLKAISAGAFSNMAGILALVATECPAEWGEPNDAKTYAQLKLDDLGLAWKAFKMEIESHKADVKVTFALDTMTIEQYDALNAGLRRANEPEVVATLLAEHVVACDVVDRVDDAEQYLELPYYTHFRALTKALSGAAEKELTNFRKRFID